MPSPFAKVMNRLVTMPMFVMAARLCPPDVEATLFALLMGLSNFGDDVGAYVGAAILQAFGGVTAPDFAHLPTFIATRTLMCVRRRIIGGAIVAIVARAAALRSPAAQTSVASCEGTRRCSPPPGRAPLDRGDPFSSVLSRYLLPIALVPIFVPRGSPSGEVEQSPLLSSPSSAAVERPSAPHPPRPRPVLEPSTGRFGATEEARSSTAVESHVAATTTAARGSDSG